MIVQRVYRDGCWIRLTEEELQRLLESVPDEIAVGGRQETRIVLTHVWFIYVLRRLLDQAGTSAATPAIEQGPKASAQ
jgi:hypothetical protein